ncbi:MAG: RlmE family RNA methyltransferase [Hyphomicrobiaceae bacterium]
MPGRRGKSGGDRRLSVRVKSARGRSTSSQKWLRRQLNDPYVAAAKRDGYRSRAAYKLAEIDDHHNILKPGHRVVDLGAAPGGWTQIAVERAHSRDGHGQVVAIDILPMDDLGGAEVLELDFMEHCAPDILRERLRLRHADVVLSDMAASATGHAQTDHMRIMALAEAAGAFALEVLAPGGSFLCKVFQGGTEKNLLDELKRHFGKVRHVKPPASRTGSSELYVLAMGFRTTGQQ